MTWIEANWFRLTIVLALLVAGFISFDVFVTQPRQEVSRNQTRVFQEKIEEELKKEETEQKYTQCITDAYNLYSLNWANSCKSRGLLSNRCAILLIDYNGDSLGGFKKYVEWHPEATYQDYSNAESDCSCSLSTSQADTWGDIKATNEATCLKRFPTS